MFLKAQEVYTKFNEENVEIKIPKELLLTLLQQISRHIEVLRYEEEVIDNFAVRNNINNAEAIMTKLLLLIAEPYGRKEVVLAVSIAEFLILRDLIFCNYSLLHLQKKMKPHILKEYQGLYKYIESIYGMLDSDEVKSYWDYIKNYKINDSLLQ